MYNLLEEDALVLDKESLPSLHDDTQSLACKLATLACISVIKVKEDSWVE